MNPSRPPTRIRSVAKAVQILIHIAEHPEGLTGRAIAEALGMPVATTHHLLETLVDEGMLAKDSHRAYSLGSRIGALADAFQRRTAPPEFLMAPLRRLGDETGETAYLSGWQGDEAVVLATVEGRHAVRVTSLHTGYTGHNNARASGKTLLAFARPGVVERYLERHELDALTPNTITDPAALRAELERTRARGYALDEEEFTAGVSCVAAPVLDGGIAIAAYTVAVPTVRFDERREELIATTRRIAAQASAPGAAGGARA